VIGATFEETDEHGLWRHGAVEEPEGRRGGANATCVRYRAHITETRYDTTPIGSDQQHRVLLRIGLAISPKGHDQIARDAICRADHGGPAEGPERERIRVDPPIATGSCVPELPARDEAPQPEGSERIESVHDSRLRDPRPLNGHQT
jgi:hypothetical protein